MSEKLRLFVAAEVPELHREWIQDQIRPLRESLSGARWTEPNSQHLTLKFLGWAQSELRDDVEAACASVAGSHHSATIRLTSPGAFPNARRARVLWVGVDDPAGLLAALAADLDRALEPLGFETEKRAFTAHLTLARLKTPGRLDLPDLGVAQLGGFDVDSIGLWRSHLAREGARYELLKNWPLNG